MRFSCKETKYPATFHLNPIRIAIVGDGRMARMMESVCIHDDRFKIAGFVGPDTHAHLDEIQNADAVIDWDNRIISSTEQRYSCCQSCDSDRMVE